MSSFDEWFQPYSKSMNIHLDQGSSIYLAMLHCWQEAHNAAGIEDRDKRIAELEERIAELEADAEVREEANQKLLSFGIKTGMERAADMADLYFGLPNAGSVLGANIRKEIDK